MPSSRTTPRSSALPINTITWIMPLALGAGLASGGCGGDKKPAKDATSVEPSATTPAATVSEPEKIVDTPNTPSASAVNISDEILKACGIPKPEAYFAFDSANLRPQDTQPLDKVTTCFISGPLKGRALKLVGHADPRGDTEYNYVLGQSRADAVAKYMQAKGLDKSHTSSTSRGAMDASGTDDASWARDRRVDVMLGQ